MCRIRWVPEPTRHQHAGGEGVDRQRFGEADCLRDVGARQNPAQVGGVLSFDVQES